MEYENLFSKSKFQDKSKVFAKFFYADEADPYQPFKWIASRAAGGEAIWAFKQERFQRQYRNPVPKLLNYLEYTFLRLQTLENAHSGIYFI